MDHSAKVVLFHRVEDVHVVLNGKNCDFRLDFFENVTRDEEVSDDRYYGFQLFQKTYEPNSDGDVENGPCAPDWYWREFDDCDFEFASPVPSDWSDEEEVADFILDAIEAEMEAEL